MRTWPIALLLLSAGAAVAGACGSTPPITVYRGAELKAVEPVQGDLVKVKRRTPEPYAGAAPGYHVLRTEEDWRRVFPSGHEASARPADMNRSMMVVVVPEAKDLDHVKVARVVETGSFVHVFVKETKRDPGCAARTGEEPVLDAVTTDRIDKPVRFYVEDEDGKSCGEPPAVAVKCRADGSQTWAEKVSAQPGDVVECEVSAESRGAFAIADRAMTIGELPGGSTAKLVYGKGAVRGTFPVDVFGAYAIKGEATDESGRKVTAVARVEAAPPKTKDLLVQLIWTNFDPSDDPDTFPRVRLRATDEGSKRECTVDTPSDGCQVKTRSAYTHMTLKGTAAKTKLVVSYTDDRVEKGPVVCVQVYFEGKRTAEACDRKARKSDERWDVGVIERANGMFEGAALAAMLASGDGGVEGGAPASVSPAEDAGASDAGPDAGTAKAGGGGGLKPPPKPPVVKPLPAKPTPPRPGPK